MALHLQQNWWLWTIRGVILIILGLIAVAIPGLVWLTFLTFFGVLAIISGIFLLVEGFRVRGNSDKLLRILEGIFYILLGLFVIAYPDVSVAVFVLVLGFWAIFIGVFQIATAIKLRKVVSGEWVLILNGILGVIFGLLLITNVVAGAEALMMIFGFFAILSGVLSIAFSFKARKFVIE